MRFAWSTVLLPLTLSLACSNEAPPLTTDTNTNTSLGEGSTGLSGPETSPTSSATTTDPFTSGDTGTASVTFPPTSTTGADETTIDIGETFEDTTTTGETSASTSSSTEATDASEGSEGSTMPILPACMDGLQNNEETDIDCGGSECPPCATDEACNLETDCESNICTDSACVAPSCSDTVKNQDETDIDCGGDACEACPDGDSCTDKNDCASGVCTDQICQPPACDDAVLNQDETSIDCGGAVCGACADGNACLLDADCLSKVCLNNICEPATCEDTVQNQDETGIDCGGADCAPCQLPGLILNEVDYDDVGTDDAEFVEIYNNTGALVSLVGVRLVLINGSNNTSYLDLDLSGGVALDQGQYLVVANAAFVVPPGVVKVNFNKANDNIQNELEGVALVDTVNSKLLDALSYEGSVTMATVPGLVGPQNLVEGAPIAGSDSTDVLRSFSRFPNGNDKNDAATDWILSATPTAGLPNVK